MTTTLVAFDCGAGICLEGRTVNSIIIDHLKECPECYRLDQALDNRNEGLSTVATMGDRDAKWLNKHEGDDDFPLEISGDAIATYNHKHEEKDAS
ncbi:MULTISPECIES: hypothetical protein [unclassified Brevibacterium]|uniref:hypothetical protein n=1 Tax=unclassified Brevibacterium TaxID=2614124 RepID=UPI001E5BBEE4|nr:MULTISPECIES: hypothetical protein [unclassified Brevibacterium]MCD1287294.1 hypothetical protein [Brevibacterium sp. CCUG 69071]MDK8436452.1 hypothetical protein [Brevibacterium sp. H-BE7]